MSVYISNAFSLQMASGFDCHTHRVSIDEARELVMGLVPGKYLCRGAEKEKDGSDAVCELIAQSCIGHADIATVLSRLIGFDIPVNRVSVSLKPGDVLVVGQYVGPRLPEGCSILPEGARIEWYVVKPGRVSVWREAYLDFKTATADGGQDALETAAMKHFPRYFDENACD
jgi:hypothetical protein